MQVGDEDDSNSDKEKTPENIALTGAGLLTDDDGERLTDSFLGDGEEPRDAEDQKLRDMLDGVDGINKSPEEEEIDEFTTFSSKEL